MSVIMAAWLAFLIGLNFSGSLPLGVPPLPEDKALVGAAPQECLFYFSSYGTAQAKSQSGNNVEKMLAEPEVKKFVNAIWKQIDAAARRGDPRRRKCFATTASAGHPLAARTKTGAPDGTF